MKIKIILNPLSGKRKAEAALRAINKAYRRKRVNFDIDITRYPRQAIYLSRQACRDKFDIIAAAGGDGTVNEVVNGLIGSDALLGIIPLGLGNDFAAGLGIPRRLQEACLALIQPAIKEIDVGRINNRCFVNSLGIGLDAQVAQKSQSLRKSFPFKWVYLFCAIRALAKYKAQWIKVELNGKIIEKKILLIAVGNGKKSGGGFLLTPQAEFDDGLLDVCIINDINKANLLVQLPWAFKGKHAQLPYAALFKTVGLRISSANPLLAQTDGELMQDYRYKIEVAPKTLRVAIPRQEK